MKKLWISSLFCALSYLGVSQCPTDEVINLSTQNQLNQFTIDFPDCDSITGDLSIIAFDVPENSQITNLAPLKKLRYIDGTLTISHASKLKDLRGLDQLQRVGGLILSLNTTMESIDGLDRLKRIDKEGLFISDNPALKAIVLHDSLEAIDGRIGFHRLSGLQRIIGNEQMDTLTGPIQIYDNPSLKNIQGFPNLKTIDWSLAIVNNDSLSDLSGLSGLEAINNAFTLENNKQLTRLPVDWQLQYAKYFRLRSLPKLVSLDGLQNLQRVGATLELQELPLLQNLRELEKLESVDNTLQLKNCHAVQDLKGLAPLQTVNHIQITDLPLIEDLQGLEQMEELSSIALEDNPGLLDLRGLENLYAIGVLEIDNCDRIQNLENLEQLSALGSLILRNNAEVKNLSGLEQVERFAHSLELKNNPQLQHIRALGAVRQYDMGSVVIENNLALESLEGLEFIDSIWIQLWLIHNPLLSNLKGLNNLKAVVGTNHHGEPVAQLKIKDCAGLKNLDGLDNLNQIWGSFDLNNTQRLTNIDALGQLRQIASRLIIIRNDSLASLLSLSNLDSIGTWVDIYQNPLLANCEAEAICDHIRKTQGAFPFRVIIEENKLGCNDMMEVLEACGPLDTQNTEQGEARWTIYPNPSSGRFQSEGPETWEGQLRVYNSQGQLLLEQPYSSKTSIDLGQAPDGLYFLELEVEGQQLRKKILKYSGS